MTDQEATERRYFWWLIGSVWISAVLSGIVVLLIVASQKQEDISQLQIHIRELKDTLQKNQCPCGPVNNRAEVHIDRPLTIEDLVQEVLKQRGLVNDRPMSRD